MVRLALQSLKMQPYKNWQMAFVDDGSDIPGKPIVEEILGEESSKVLFINTNSTREQKQERGGSKFGKCWNLAMYNSNADIGIMLCDDDALYTDYLANLSKFYTANPHINYSYGHVSIFNPSLFNDINDVPTNLDTSYAEYTEGCCDHLNKFTTTINPFHTVDSSQVSWLIVPAKEKNIGFPYPKTINLDAVLYRQLHENFGGCVYNGLITQYKGVHADQLGVRAKTHKTVIDDLYHVKDS
jgi:hypothetical protein